MVNGEVIWKWNCESYSFKRFKWYLHYENWYSWWTESDWQIIWWLTCVIVLISSSHDYDDFLRAMWVFHTSCIFLINIYDDDVYTTAYTPIYSVPFHGTDPHLRMWAAFSQNVGYFRCSVPGLTVILRAHCSISSVVVSPHVPRTWCLMLVSRNYLYLITEYE